MKKTIIGILMVTLLMFGSVFAYSHNQGEEKNCEEMQSIFEQRDFQAFTQLSKSKGKMREHLNEDNFHLFVEAREERLNGNLEPMNELKEEFGLSNKEGKQNQKKMMKNQHRNNN